jgi:hypothetical protein
LREDEAERRGDEEDEEEAPTPLLFLIFDRVDERERPFHFFVQTFSSSSDTAFGSIARHSEASMSRSAAGLRNTAAQAILRFCQQYYYCISF